MAVYQSNIQIDTTGTGPVTTETPTATIATTTQIRLQYGSFFLDFTGDFQYNGPGGTLSGGSITFVKTYPGIAGPTLPATFLESFEASVGEAIDFLQYASLTGEALSAYLFQFDDSLTGSTFDDKLASFAGDDFILANEGNDKLYGGTGKDFLVGGPGNDKYWGGGGKDAFIYAEDGKDRLKDFNIRKDSLLIDRDSARNFKQIQEIADQQGSKVVFDFGGGNKLIIDKLNVDHLDDVGFSFLDL